MPNFFDINHIFFTVLGYEMSYLEFFGTITGGIAVWLAAKANIWSWPVGLISVTLLFFLFYQSQLYPDMFLQAFFFVTNLMGWWRWSHPKIEEEDKKHELKISWMPRRELIIVFLVGLTGTFVMGSFASRLHEIFPTVFSKPSAFPYLDSFVTVMSILTTFLMIQKKIECWIIWVMVDIIATYIYYTKGIRFLALEYLVFCFLASYGFWDWRQVYKTYSIRA